jgi:hypothetical protein
VNSKVKWAISANLVVLFDDAVHVASSVQVPFAGIPDTSTVVNSAESTAGQVSERREPFGATKTQVGLVLVS